MKRFVVALSALTVLALPATSCSTQTSGAGKPAPSPSTRQAPPPAAHIGDTLNLNRIGEGRIAVTLERIINPATVPHGWGDADKTYIATQLTITNTGTSTIVGNANSDVAVVGSDKQTYKADYANVTECDNFVYGWFLIPSGASTVGCVTFALPPAVTPAKVKYMPSSGISHDTGEWLNH